VDYLTPSLVRSGLKDRDNLFKFFADGLGYITAPVFWEAKDLDIPQYLSTRIISWWLISRYPGRIPFQVHFAEVKELTFYICRDIVMSFLRSHPANYLFIFTQDYSYIVFFAVERSFEKRPYTWRREPKYYYRFLFADCSNPTSNDLNVLEGIRLAPSLVDSAIIYDKVVAALKISEYGNELPEWFMPWYYRMGYSEEAYDKLRESGMI
jgi:hypothetical protein